MILAASTWLTNGELIADVATLYIKPSDLVVDLTYHRGLWWTKYHHDRSRFLGLQWRHDDRRAMAPPDPCALIDDFAFLPLDDETVDVVAFDPPYISKGGRDTSTIDEMDAAYGLREANRTPRGLHIDNMGGFSEACRIVKPQGYVMVKCMDYISSGKLQPVTQWTITAAEEMYKMKLVDRFEHVGHPGPQSQTRQVHARRNLSTLLMFKKGGRRGRTPA